jgi:hypothetical protein
LKAAARDVVQLGTRRADVLVPRVPHHAQVAPAELEPRHHRLGVRLCLASVIPAFDASAQASPLGVNERRDAEVIENGGRQIDELDRAVDHAAAREHSRSAQQERNVQRALIEEQPVGLLTMLAEALAVVADDREQRAVEESLRAQL